MKYGIHTPLVEEVIDFAKGDGLLQSQNQGTNANWHIVHDLDEAQRFAWELPPDADEDLWTEWTDLRELETAGSIGRSYEIEGFSEVDDALTETLELFATLVRPKLDDQHSELLDDIIADLHNCAFSRAVDGGDDFSEELFRAYQAGGWPCGWLGVHPAGQLVVYMRM